MDGRVYLSVESVTEPDGLVTPLAVRWPDGRRWEARVVSRRPGHEGVPDRWRDVRYVVELGRRRARRTVWYDRDGRWYALAREATGTGPSSP